MSTGVELARTVDFPAPCPGVGAVGTMRVRRERPQVHDKSGTVALSPGRRISLFCSSARPTRTCGGPRPAASLIRCCLARRTRRRHGRSAWSPGSNYSNSIRAEHRPKRGAAICTSSYEQLVHLRAAPRRRRRDASIYVAFGAASADAAVSCYVPS